MNKNRTNARDNENVIKLPDNRWANVSWRFKEVSSHLSAQSFIIMSEKMKNINEN